MGWLTSCCRFTTVSRRSYHVRSKEPFPRGAGSGGELCTNEGQVGPVEIENPGKKTTTEEKKRDPKGFPHQRKIEKLKKNPKMEKNEKQQQNNLSFRPHSLLQGTHILPPTSWFLLPATDLPHSRPLRPRCPANPCELRPTICPFPFPLTPTSNRLLKRWIRSVPFTGPLGAVVEEELPVVVPRWA